jgi:hypothetical protein
MKEMSIISKNPTRRPTVCFPSTGIVSCIPIVEFLAFGSGLIHQMILLFSKKLGMWEIHPSRSWHTVTRDFLPANDGSHSSSMETKVGRLDFPIRYLTKKDGMASGWQVDGKWMGDGDVASAAIMIHSPSASPSALPVYRTSPCHETQVPHGADREHRDEGS